MLPVLSTLCNTSLSSRGALVAPRKKKTRDEEGVSGGSRGRSFQAEKEDSLTEKECLSAVFWEWSKYRNVKIATKKREIQEILRIDIVISKVHFFWYLTSCAWEREILYLNNLYPFSGVSFHSIFVRRVLQSYYSVAEILAGNASAEDSSTPVITEAQQQAAALAQQQVSKSVYCCHINRRT